MCLRSRPTCSRSRPSTRRVSRTRCAFLQRPPGPSRLARALLPHRHVQPNAAASAPVAAAPIWSRVSSLRRVPYTAQRLGASRDSQGLGGAVIDGWVAPASLPICARASAVGRDDRSSAFLKTGVGEGGSSVRWPTSSTTACGTPSTRTFARSWLICARHRRVISRPHRPPIRPSARRRPLSRQLRPVPSGTGGRRPRRHSVTVSERRVDCLRAQRRDHGDSQRPVRQRKLRFDAEPCRHARRS